MRRLSLALACALITAPAYAQTQYNPVFDSVNGVRSVIHADPTGINDSAPAINAVLAADAQGIFHNVYLPIGIYRLKSPITISANRNAAGTLTGQCLFGDNKTQPTLLIGTDYSPTAGSPVQMTGNGDVTPCLRNISIIFENGFGGTRATAAPLPNCGHGPNVECRYPAGVDLTNANNASLQDVYIGGAWDCIHAAWTISNGVTELRNITCGAYDRGLDLSGSTGIINVTNYHFYPWSIGTQSIYLDGNTYAAYLSSVQGLTAHNFFSQSGRIAIVGSAQPSFSEFVNLGMDHDNATFEVNSNSTFVTIAGGYFTGSGTGANQTCNIQLTGGSIVQASSVQFRASGTSTVPILCNSAGTLLVSNSQLVTALAGQSAVSLTGGGTVLTGNDINVNSPSAWTVPLILQTGGWANITGNDIAMIGGSGIAIAMADSGYNSVTGNTFGSNWSFTPPGVNGSYVGTAWASYTPSVTCATGSLNAYTAQGWYQHVGKQMQLHVLVRLTDAGTCAGNLVLNEPLGANPITSFAIGTGRENSNGASLTAFASGDSIFLYKYDGTSDVATGNEPLFSINYVTQ